jgi:hypothetical protein
MAVLMDPKIEARPLQMPGIMQIRPKDSTVAFHWVRRKGGNSPDSTRYLEMKAAGYTDATLDDCDPMVNAVNVTDKGTQITCGIDLILMKAPKRVHYAALKEHSLRAIKMTDFRSQEFKNATMKSEDYSGIGEARTRFSSEQEQESAIGSETAVVQGTPQWEAIAEAQKKSKGGR